MQEQVAPQFVPLKIYRAPERLTIAAPMPGLEPEDIVVEVTTDGRLILDGALRGTLKGVKELLVDEWNVGGYHREVPLPAAVDARLATLTYGNGVLVTVLPLAARTEPATLTLERGGPARGERVGSAGHPVRPVTTEEHRRALAAAREGRGAPAERPGPALP
jgi:HSP20 family protein